MVQSKFSENLVELLQGEVEKEKLQILVSQLSAGKTLEEAVEIAGISEEALAKAKGKFFDLPYFDIFSISIESKVLNFIPRDIAVNYQVVPFDFNEQSRVLKIGIVDPGNFKAIEAVEFLARKNNYRPKYYVITPSGFKQAIKKLVTLGKEVEEVLDLVEKERREKMLAVEKKEAKEDFEEVIKSAPVSKMVASILKHAVQGNASDIHIEPAENYSKVRYRVDGILHTSLKLPKHLHNSIVTRLKVMSNLKIDETRIPQDGRIRVDIDNRKVDLRISFLPLFNAEKVVIRILDVSNKKLSLSELGFWGRGLEILEENINKAHGMMLVTGPTGSGKSTTLYSVLNILNKEGVNILTLEDPIEYWLEGVNQSQINPEVGYTFATGLRAALRQDPDIIMVGEIRDNETAELAIHAALTGHMVLSTLHTNDAIGAIPRLVDMHIEPFLIASTLNAVIAQRLVRKICSHCKGEVKKVSDKVLADIKDKLKNIKEDYLPEEVREKLKQDKFSLWRGRGCPRCGNSGYQGRIALVEILSMDDKLKEVIINNQMDEISRIFVEQGYLNMQQDGMVKVIMGETTIEEVLRVTKI